MIMVIRARGGERLQEVANISADAEIADATDVNRYPHTAAGATCVFQA